MRKNNNQSLLLRRLTGIMLALCLCLTMMPAAAFADAATGSSQTESAAGADTAAASDAGTKDTPAPAPSRKAKAFKWSGIQLKFKTNVLIDEALPASAGPAKTTITGQKKSMKVTWSKAKQTGAIDGYIILRKAGKETVYTQIAKVGKGISTYTDKSARKKNTGYFYTVVSFRNKGNDIRISPCATWAAGMTTKSKYKNGYKAKISKSSVSLQAGEGITVKASYDKPKKIYNSGSVRWYTDNAKVAKVNKGIITAVAPGTTKIRGRLASGRDVTCSVRVVGAYKPSAPVLSLEYATTSSIVMSWNKTGRTKKYELYRSVDGGSSYSLITEQAETTYTDSGLRKGKAYSYYVIAVNENGKYIMRSDKSQILTQEAVKTPRKTTVTGFPSEASPTATKTYSVVVKVSVPDGRKASIQTYENKKWVTKKTVTLPAGLDTASVKLIFPDTWWKKDSTTWRLSIPASDDSKAYTSGKLVLKTKRLYQNPKGYVQISNKISKHGHSYYTAPVLVDNTSTKKDHIEAMIKTAYKYKGDPYVVCQSRAPGKGVDCSGLVMQACYGAGVDLWPSNPYRHRSPAYEYESRNIAKMSKLKTVPYKDRKRGDLIFYANSNGVVIHVAIYLGNNKIIHSAPPGVRVSGISYKYGHVSKVKRIFN